MKTDDREKSGKIGSRTESEALASAFRILARRDHTRRELAAKLHKKRFDPPAIDGALARCSELGYLDDERTAMKIAGHLLEKGYGMLRVRQVLGQKGLDEALIATALTGCADEEAQVKRARLLLEKRALRQGRQAPAWQRLQAAHRFLAGRGFPSAVIGRVLSQESAQNGPAQPDRSPSSAGRPQR